MKNFRPIKNCRISGKNDLVRILDLGIHPLANSLKSIQTDIKEKFPLSISFSEESSLVQLNETVDKETLFNHYVWVTGTAKATKRYSNIFFENLITNTSLKKNDFVVEIASNDGTFLKPFLQKGYNNIQGIDPAINIAKIANNNGVPTIPKYWSSQLAKKIKTQKGLAKVVFARNVIPHVSELLDVIEGIQIILSESGTGIIEFHYLGNILEGLQYDSIYHEHLCYFSINSITYLLNRFNLFPYHIENSPISGGARSIYFGKTIRNKSTQLKSQIKLENNLKINELSTWKNFAKKVESHKAKTIEILDNLKGKKILGFGSSARSQTYLNYCNIDTEQICAIVDNNSLKQGKFAPGSSIPIVSMKDGLSMNPDIIFILAWNFQDEIIASCKRAGCKAEFLIPFPLEPFFYQK